MIGRFELRLRAEKKSGAGAVDTARTLGTETLDRARSATDKVTIDLAEQALRRRAEEEARKEREAIEAPEEGEALPTPPRRG